MAKTLGDVRKSIKDFNDQVYIKKDAVQEQESVKMVEKLINEAIVNVLPDETELPEEAESYLSFIERAVRQAENTKISPKKT